MQRLRCLPRQLFGVAGLAGMHDQPAVTAGSRGIEGSRILCGPPAPPSLLPYDDADQQQIQRARHNGEDQTSGTQFADHCASAASAGDNVSW